MSTVEDRVRELIEPLLGGQGLELVDLEYGRGLLRVTVDRDGGVDLGAITDANHQISALLDRHDPVPGGRYVLEVTSPGVERPLRTPDQFRRFRGTKVNVKTHPEVEGDRRIEGELTDVDDEGIVVAGRRLAYGDIERARTVFEWGPATKPRKPGKPAKAGRLKKSARKRATT